MLKEDDGTYKQVSSLALELESFPLRLKEVIGEQSTKGFADQMGIAEGTVRNMMSGGLPRLDNLLRIARAGKVSVHWLATGEGDKYPDQAPDPDPLKHLRVDGDIVYSSKTIPPGLAERMKRYRRIYDEAVQAVGWEPSGYLAAAIQTMIFVEPTEVEQVVLLLQAIKDQCGSTHDV